MPHPLEAGTIRILKPDGSTAGTGFLVSKRLAVTCAHVVESAGVGPGERVEYKYHLGDWEVQKAIVLENGWSPENDIAILELTEKPPKWIRPIIMQSSRAMEGRAFQGLGYPDDGPVQTRWPQGNIGGRVDVDEYANPLLQLQGREIDKGLSGSAIVDRTTRRVIGMITAYQDIKRPSDTENIRFGYAIPIEIVWKIYPELEKELPPLPKRSSLVEGIHLLPYGYDFRIQNFLTEYLGTPEQPEPFGGRENAIQQLDEWLEDGAQRLLLAAPAGRGKSALLVRWVNHLIAREDLALVFMPVSVRFRTNLSSTFFASLGARLAYIHGEEVPMSDATSTEVWRGLVSTYLTKPLTDGQILMVVLDGLDEAGDWEATADLIPSELPTNVRVVVSARYLAGDLDGDPWLTRLGWEHTGKASVMYIDPLDAIGISDVLLKMGVPLDELSKRVDIVSELHRLSEGDPLLVNLYVEDLWKRGEEISRLRPELLRTIEPGYKGFFDRWWSDQRKLWGKEVPLREKSVRLIFNLFCGAFGGLTKDDLSALDTYHELNSYFTEDALDALKRFIIGIPDEKREKHIAYVLSHPKLRDYFWNKLSEKERKEIESRFVRWGNRTMQALIEEDLKPANTPIYLLQHYVEHLDRTHALIELYFQVIDYPYWHQAWFAYDGSYSGYSENVKQVWKKCEENYRIEIDRLTRSYFLGKMTRCALIVISLRNLAMNISSDLLVSLLQEKIITVKKAVTIIRQMSNEEILAKALRGITKFLPEHLISEALEIVFAMNNEREQARCLIELAPLLTNEMMNDILRKVSEYKNEEIRVDSLLEFSSCLPDLDKESLMNNIFYLVDDIEDTQLRSKLLFKIAPFLDNDKKVNALSAALEMQQNESGKELKVKIICDLFTQLSGKNQSKLLDEMMKMISDFSNMDPNSFGAFGIMDSLHKLVSSVMSHTPYDLKNRALRLLYSIYEQSKNIDLCCCLIPYMDKELRMQALDTLHKISKSHLLYYINDFAPYLSYIQKYELLLYIEKHNTDKTKIPLDSAIPLYLKGFAPYLPDDLIAQALLFSGEINNEHSRADMLVILMPYLNNNLKKRIVGIIDGFYNMELRVNLFIALLPHLSDGLRADVLMRALKSTNSIADSKVRALQLVKLSTYVSNENRLSLLRESLNLSRIIDDIYPRIMIISKFSECLPMFKDNSLQALQFLEEWSDENRSWNSSIEEPQNLSFLDSLNKTIELTSQDTDTLAIFRKYLPSSVKLSLSKQKKSAFVFSFGITKDTWKINFENALSDWKKAGFQGYDEDVWEQMLYDLAFCQRGAFFRALTVFWPMIQPFSSQEFVSEVCIAVYEITSWWP